MLTLTKLDVQRKVLKNGKPLDLALFDWDENTRIFSTKEICLVLDFSGLDNCIFNTGFSCTFKTGHSCTFNTGYTCTFNTGNNSRFKTGVNSVVVRRDIFEIIPLKENIEIILCPYKIEGYLEKINNKFTYSEDQNKENEYIIIDNILSKVISQKGNVLKVQNYNDSNESYIVKDGDLYSHGETIEEARKSLIYKIGNRDTSMYKDLNLDSILLKDECIKMYRVITGACEYGTRNFVSKQEPSKMKDKYSIRELIELTKGQFGNDILVKFLKGE